MTDQTPRFRSSDDRLRTGVSLVVLAAALVGCDSEPILVGNFDQWPADYTVGELPGDPDGDTVFQFGQPVPGGVTWYPGMILDDQLAFVDAACPIGQPCNSAARMMLFYASPIDPGQVGDPIHWGLAGDAYIQPGCDLEATLFAGHFESIATLRFTRPGPGPATMSVVHGGGEVAVDSLSLGESFGYLVSVEPEIGSFALAGDASASDLPVLSSPASNGFGITLKYTNAVATGCAVAFDDLAAFVEVP